MQLPLCMRWFLVCRRAKNRTSSKQTTQMTPSTISTNTTSSVTCNDTVSIVTIDSEAPHSSCLSPTLALNETYPLPMTPKNPALSHQKPSRHLLVSHGNTNAEYDAFDHLRCPALEMLRADITSLVGVTGEDMVSKALTFAFLSGFVKGATEKQTEEYSRYSYTSDRELKVSGIQIEVDILFEAFVWMKRQSLLHSFLPDAPVVLPSLSDRRLRLQTYLNEMVLLVRSSKIDAESASRVIHNTAALLELEAAKPIFGNAIIISGLRKTCTAADLYAAFNDFCDSEEVNFFSRVRPKVCILSAAVASTAVSGSQNGSGFALVRFRNKKTLNRVLDKYRNDEIVVQDVAIVIKLLIGKESSA